MSNFKLATCCMIDSNFGYKSTTKTSFLKNKDYSKLVSIWRHNVAKTREAFQYLLSQPEVYHYFRVSSTVFPLNTLPETHDYWKSWFRDEGERLCNEVGDYVLSVDPNFRAVTHPNQFVVVNSKSEKVYDAAVQELEATYSLMTALKLPFNINVHLAGKDADAKSRSIRNHKKLPAHVANVLSYENDEKSSCIADVLDVCEATGALPCFDVHHEAVFNTFKNQPYKLPLLPDDTLRRVESLWTRTSLRPTFHVSNRLELHSVKGKACAHSDYLYEDDNEVLCHYLSRGWDLEVEAKAKFPAVKKFYEKYYVNNKN